MKYLLLFLIIPYSIISAKILWQENFETASTHLDKQLTPKDSTIQLTENQVLEEWPKSGGKAVVDGYNPNKRDYFSYKKRSGNILEGVKGIERNHPEGSEVTLSSYGNSVEDSHDTLCAIHGPFGISRVVKSKTIEKKIDATNHLFVRFYFKVDSFSAKDINEKSLIYIHSLQPDYPIAIELRPKSETEVLLDFRLRRHLKMYKPVSLDLHTSYCIEYEIRVDSVKMEEEISFWLNDSLLGTKIVKLKKKEIFQFLALRFAHNKFFDPSINLYAFLSMDEIIYGDSRIGPISAGNKINLEKFEDHYIFKAIDTVDAEQIQIEITQNGNWRFPLFGRISELGEDAIVHIKFMNLPDGEIEFRHKIKRKNKSWSEWSIPTNLDWPKKHIPERPVIDSVILYDIYGEKITAEIEAGAWYDLYFYSWDPKGFRNLYYNYIFLHNSRYPYCDVTNRGGVFDPKASYFISQSKDQSGRNNVYIKEVEGEFFYTNPVCNTCSTYVDCNNGCFEEDSTKGYWKTRFRIGKEADLGTWELKCTMINKQEIASFTYTQKLRVIAPKNKTKTALYYLLLIFPVLGLIIFFAKKKKAIQQKDGENKEEKQFDFRVQQTLDFINKNFGQDLSLSSLAFEVKANDSWLSRTFKKEVGEGIVQYINKVRCEKAAALLSVNILNISQISYKTGFKSPDYFKQVFKKYYGKSPSQFRKEELNIS